MIGIDKLSLSIRDYKVQDANQLSIDLGKMTPEGETTAKPLFNGIEGSKAYMNKDNYNVTINPNYGNILTISFNPSKILHPYEMCNDNNQLKGIWSGIKRDMRESGIILPEERDISTTRIDLAKNIETEKPVSHYSRMFESLRGKRMNTVTFPSSHYFRNKSQEIVFYDKNLEIEHEYKKNKKIPPSTPECFMRGEYKAKKKDKVSNVFKFNSLDYFLESDPSYREGIFKEQLEKQVFHKLDKPEQLEIFTNYDAHLAYLKMLKEGRNALLKFMAIHGTEKILNDLGSFGVLKNLLVDAGYTNDAAVKEVNKLRKNMQSASFVYASRNNETFMSQYNEILTKFVA